MGNKIARTTQVSPSQYYLHELPSSYNLVLFEVLCNGRFFKSILCRHDEGLVLVKVYFKRGDTLDFKEYERRLKEIRHIFKNIQHRHLWPFQFWLETDKAVYLLRQYFFSNLHDRLSTRPFLSLIEKKWLAFQLLCAVKQSHDNGICHGDIKCENVLVSSWNWVYLADFASFKPTYIPDDDPSDFSFFFDTGGRRRCYLAPERFYEHGGEMQIQPDAPLKPSMDIFSVGCVIAELFLEGQPLFELSQLLAYRRGQFDPRTFLDKIPVAGISKMITHMIQLNPEERLSCESYLQEYGSVVFPNYFTPFLHKFFSCLIPAEPDARVAMTQGAFQELHKQIVINKSCEDVILKTLRFSEEMEFLTKQRTDIMNELWNKYDTGERNTSAQSQLNREISSLLKNTGKRQSINLTYENASCIAKSAILASDVKYSRQQTFNHPLLPLCKGYSQKEYYHLKRILKCDLKSFMDKCKTQPDALLLSFFPGDRCTLQCEGMVLIASLLCSFMRSVKQPHLRRGSLLLLMSSSLHIDDENLLQLVIPFIIVMLSDPSAIVRCAALEALCNILPLVQEFPPSDAKIFPEYILPMLSTLPDDPEESVRVCYASNISKIALTAYRFLICSNILSDIGIVEKQSSSTKKLLPIIETPGNKQIGNIDAELTKLRTSIADIVQELVMGPKNTKNIRRALLQDIGHLCFFFGQSMTSDFILAILPAFLNDRDDQLRADFYGQIVFVCFFVGKMGIERFLLPYIDQGLSDNMEVVIVNVLECLTMLCNSNLLRKKILLDMIERAFPLLCFPLLCVRRAAISFIATSSKIMGLVDSNIYIYPLLYPFLQRKPNYLSSEVSLLASLKPPVSIDEFYRVRDNARSRSMLDNQKIIWYKNGIPNQWESKDYSCKEYISSGASQSILPNTDHTARSRTVSDKLFNNTSTLDNKDSFSPEKKHFPGFMSAHITSGNSLFHDKPSQDMPLYSLSMNKHSIVSGAANSDDLLQWNTVGNNSIPSPSLDRVSKSFLSTSDQPKLISGSIYNISNASMKTSSSVQKLENYENNQSSYHSSKFHELSLSDALNPSSVASADDIALQSDVSGSTSPITASCDKDARWRPRGVLVAHLQEHRSAVNDITVSNDNSFFVTASDDSSIKLWDTRKLERDISFRSKLTYNLDGMKALCTTILSANAQIVVGASDGHVHLFSIDYISRGVGSAVEKYSGIADIKKKQIGEGAILSLLNCPTGDGSFSNTILFSTQLCGIHLWDTRADSIAWRFKVTSDKGYVSSLVIGNCGNWFVSGTSRGMMTLWDRRFLLPLNSWQCSKFCPIEKICLFTPSENNLSSSMGKPLVYVASGLNEISLWNAENGRCHQIFKYTGCEGDSDISSNSPCALIIPSNKSSSKHSLKNDCTPDYMTNELNGPSLRLSGVRSLFSLPGGDFLSGGTDLKIRYWDHNCPARSFCVCGPSTKSIVPEDVYNTQTTFGVQVVQETNRKQAEARPTQKAILAIAATDSAGCHCDSVLSLASMKWNQRLLISGSRDGAIKVWK